MLENMAPYEYTRVTSSSIHFALVYPYHKILYVWSDYSVIVASVWQSVRNPTRRRYFITTEEFKNCVTPQIVKVL